MIMKGMCCTFFISLIFSNLSNAQLAKCKGKYLGNIIQSGTIRDNYKDLWNAVSSENACKWGEIEKTRDNMNWSGADRAYNYARANNMKFRWHALVWGGQNQYPTWLSSLSVADARAETREFMEQIAARYDQGRYIDQIDVLNENLIYNPSGGYRPGEEHAVGTPMFREKLGGPGITGYDWAIWLFETAREVFPHSKLVLNDFALENDHWAIREMLKLVKVLKDRNLIDGFGTQAHDFNVNTLTAAQLKASLDLMATGGVPIYVTELDISADNENLQKTRYETLFPVYWEHPNVAGVSLWGYISGETWATNTGIQSANGVDDPALTWLKSYMASRPTLNPCEPVTSTDEEAVANDIKVYPNPFSTAFQIESNFPVDYSITDMLGKIVEEGRAEGPSTLGRDLSTGIYMLRWKENEKIRTLKITKN